MGDKFQYGGQAVIEGVMMRGRQKLAIAVRKPDDEIIIEERPITSITQKIPFLKLPFVRGTVMLFEALIIGVQALAFSANEAAEGEEEELSSLEMAVSISIAVVLGVLLFVVAPTAIARLLYGFSTVFVNIGEGIFRIGIFILYVVAISRIKDIQRVYQYHGAEHKVINAFEAGEELTVENARRHSPLHPRCGTSFLLIVMVIMILIFGFLGKPELLVRIVSRIVLLPVVAGVSYEVLKLSGKYCHTWLMKIIIAPGMWLQKLTTREADDSQLEVAIRALSAVLPAENSKAQETPDVSVG